MATHSDSRNAASNDISVIGRPTDVQKLQQVMNEQDTGAIFEALFGRPMGIPQIDSQIAEIRAIVEDFQQSCLGCANKLTLLVCRNCGNFVCADCRKDHCCGSGDAPTQFRY